MHIRPLLNLLVAGSFGAWCCAAGGQDEVLGPPLPPPPVTTPETTVAHVSEPASGMVYDASSTEQPPTPAPTPIDEVHRRVEQRPLGKPSRAASNGSAQAHPAEGVERSSLLGWGRVVGSLAAVLALVWALAFGFKALARRQGGLVASLGAGGRAPAGVLEVLGRYPVSRGHQLVVIRFDRRILLASQQAGGRLRGPAMSVLCELGEPEDVASVLTKMRDAEGESTAAGFNRLLREVERRPLEEASTLQLNTPIPRRLLIGTGGDRLELLDDSRAANASDDVAVTSIRRRLSSLRALDDDRREEPW